MTKLTWVEVLSIGLIVFGIALGLAGAMTIEKVPVLDMTTNFEVTSSNVVPANPTMVFIPIGAVFAIAGVSGILFYRFGGEDGS